MGAARSRAAAHYSAGPARRQSVPGFTSGPLCATLGRKTLRRRSAARLKEPPMPWDPDRYLQFREERYATFADLLALINVRPGLRVIDLGCGGGELTRRLADALPDSDVLGIDTSPEMLARAAEYARPGLRFEQRALEHVTGAWDLVF